MEEQIIRFFLGELSKDERIELLRKRDSDPVLMKIFSDYQNAVSILSLIKHSDDKENALKNLHVLKQNTRHRRIRKRIYTVMGYAAAISLLVISTWFLTSKYTGKNYIEPIAGQQEFYVPAGQRARITLPDGTTAWLNAGSTLKYPSVFQKERRVSLSGEAYFDVAKNEKAPFIVSTDIIDIKALGTSFNVFSYPKSSTQNIILLDGKIKVYNQGTESDGIIMSPNQQLFCENDNFRLEQFNNNNVLLWRDGIYSFQNEKLDNIISKLELYFDVEIIINSPSLLEKEYTGKFRQKDGVMEILRIIQKIHYFKIYKDDDLNQITLSR
jgi:ferric-dicitrate binding protein FerR (iron transport regulator)